MKWGLVIQGPLVTYGQGPNNAESGFSAITTINVNIENFLSIVDHIVLSTWDDANNGGGGVENQILTILIQKILQ